MTDENTAENEDAEIKLLLEMLHDRFHYDFRDYILVSIKRRVAQALEELEIETIAALRERLVSDPTMFPVLLNYITVQFSEIFRNPTYFKAIRDQVLPTLQEQDSINVWVAGCSDGEELYSLAILFREAGLEQKTKFYATDINQTALNNAQAGRYLLNRLELFGENYVNAGGAGALSDYYTIVDRRAVFDESLRQNVAFSHHNLLKDSAFAEMHLISCRNVLIYLEQPQWNHVIGLFKNSLVTDGFLGLGPVETVRASIHSNGFDNFVFEERIFRRNGE